MLFKGPVIARRAADGTDKIIGGRTDQRGAVSFGALDLVSVLINRPLEHERFFDGVVVHSTAP